MYGFPAVEPLPRFFKNAEMERIARSYTTAPGDLQLRVDDALVGELKICDAWFDWDFFYLFGNHTPQAGIINWVNPGQYDATATSAFTAHRQFSGNGSSTFVNTNFDATTAVNPKFQRDSCCLGFWCQNTGANAVSDAGRFVGTTGCMVSARVSVGSGNCMFVRMNNTTALDTGASSALTSFGLSAGDRSASNSVKAFRNGVQLGSTASTASEAVVSGNFAFGRTSDASFNNRSFTLGFLGRSMSDAKHLAVYAAFNRRLKAFGGAP